MMHRCIGWKSALSLSLAFLALCRVASTQSTGSNDYGVLRGPAVVERGSDGGFCTVTADLSVPELNCLQRNTATVVFQLNRAVAIRSPEVRTSFDVSHSAYTYDSLIVVELKPNNESPCMKRQEVVVQTPFKDCNTVKAKVWYTIGATLRSFRPSLFEVSGVHRIPDSPKRTWRFVKELDLKPYRVSALSALIRFSAKNPQNMKHFVPRIVKSPVVGEWDYVDVTDPEKTSFTGRELLVALNVRETGAATLTVDVECDDCDELRAELTSLLPKRHTSSIAEMSYANALHQENYKPTQLRFNREKASSYVASVPLSSICDVARDGLVRILFPHNNYCKFSWSNDGRQFEAEELALGTNFWGWKVDDAANPCYKDTPLELHATCSRSVFEAPSGSVYSVKKPVGPNGSVKLSMSLYTSWNGNGCTVTINSEAKDKIEWGDEVHLWIEGYPTSKVMERKVIRERLAYVETQLAEPRNTPLVVEGIEEEVCESLRGSFFRYVQWKEDEPKGKSPGKQDEPKGKPPVTPEDKTTKSSTVSAGKPEETTTTMAGTPSERTTTMAGTPSERTTGMAGTLSETTAGRTGSRDVTEATVRTRASASASASMASVSRSNAVTVKTMSGGLVGMHDKDLTAFLESLRVSKGVRDGNSVKFNSEIMAEELHQLFVLTYCLSTSDAKYVKSVVFGSVKLELAKAFKNGKDVVQCYVLNSCNVWKALSENSKSQLVVLGSGAATVPDRILWRLDKAVKLEAVLPEDKKQTDVSRAGWYGTPELRSKYTAPAGVEQIDVVDEGTTARCVSRTPVESEGDETSAVATYVYFQPPFETKPMVSLLFSGDWYGLSGVNVIVALLAATIAVYNRDH